MPFSSDPFSYPQEYDLLTGSYYYDARWYDPATGKFLNEDPIGKRSGDVNFYRYVGNNPVIYVDPFGLRVVKCGNGISSKYIQVPDTWHGGDPCSFILGGGLLGWQETPLPAAESQAVQLCAGVANCNKPGCTVASCEKAMAQLLTAVSNTHPFSTGGWGGRVFPSLANPCQNWVDELQRQLPPNFESNPCFQATGEATTQDLGHVTYVITLCDGTKIGADNKTNNPNNNIFLTPRFPLYGCGSNGKGNGTWLPPESSGGK